MGIIHSLFTYNSNPISPNLQKVFAFLGVDKLHDEHTYKNWKQSLMPSAMRAGEQLTKLYDCAAEYHSPETVKEWPDGNEAYRKGTTMPPLFFRGGQV